jgi:steroid delta-isomerase-like uncharacterized protein
MSSEQEKQEITIPQMVEQMRTGKLSRRHFIVAATGLGITALGAGVIATVAESNAFRTKATHVVNADEHVSRNINLHDQHMANQANGDQQGMINDYAPDAVVEDSMYEGSFVGHEAIRSRKGQGMAAIPDLKFQVLSRKGSGSQVVAEWVATGTHSGNFPGLPATGRQFSIRGVTVVIRKNGKIVRESLYYDMAEVRRQLGA